MRDKILSKSILIGGCARSGTTILGKVIGSFRNVEYFFEPPFVHKAMYSHMDIPIEEWKRIMSWYLYDDLLLNAISGRNLNWNRNDDSCVLNYKGEEIRERLNKSHRKLDLERIAKSSRLSVKVPDLAFHIPKFMDAFPGIQGVAVVRSPSDVITSIIGKEWFSTGSLSLDTPEPQIPFQVDGGIRVPRFVPSADTQMWVEMSGNDRAAYYYMLINNFISVHADRFILISYDRLVSNPRAIVQRLAEALGCEFGSRTEAVLESISERPPKFHDLSASLSADMYKQVEAFSSTYEMLLKRSLHEG